MIFTPKPGASPYKSSLREEYLLTSCGEEIKLATSIWEPGGEPVGDVVMMHGGGQTRHAWRDTGLVLSQRGWRVISYDARGHGSSGWSHQGHYGARERVSDLMDTLSLCKSAPVLVGASMGGMTAIEACGAYPQRFRALVLVDVALRVETAESRKIHAFMRARPEGFATLDEVADAVQAYNPARKRSTSTEGLKRNVEQRADGRWHWRWDPRILTSDRSQLEHMAVSLREAAKRILIPVLLVRGLKSQMVDDQTLAEFTGLVPQAAVADIKGAGHMVAGDDNNVFAETVVGFLDRVAASTEALTVGE